MSRRRNVTQGGLTESKMLRFVYWRRVHEEHETVSIIATGE